MLEGSQLPTLEAERVRLRWLCGADVPALFALFSDQEVTRYWSWAAFTEIRQAEELLGSIGQHFVDGSLYQWGIERQSEPGIVGTCTLADVDPANLRAEVGFALGRPYWAMGYAAEALQTLLLFAFTEMGLRRLEADVDPRNERAVRVLEKQGFRREGYARERWRVRGEVCDSVMLGLLASERISTPPR